MDLVKELAKALLPELEQQRGRAYGFKHDTPAGGPITAGYTHGPGGLLSFPGADPDVFNAAVGTHSLLGQLPTKATLYTNPTYWVLTGVQDITGSEKDGVCDDAPVAGLMKACLQTSVFGRYERATAELELNRLGAQTDRADPMDLRLIGTPLGNTAGGVFGAGPGNPETPADLLTNEVARKFWERNVAFHRLLSRQLWIGNPANNAGAGGYKEITGMDRLITTGVVDAETGQACAAADSYISNFSYGRIDQSADAIVAAVTDVYYQLTDRAIRSGVMPVRWIIAMRPQLFYELTAVWPCSYLTYRCQVSGNEQVNIDARDQVRFRDEMRAGKYLLIDGERVEVIIDEGIAELNGNESGSFPPGCFATDIYFIPMSVVGGRSVTFLEYFQYQNPSIQTALSGMVLGRIEGAFLTWPRQNNQCISWQSKVEPRLVLRTPWLAGRLQNVVYCPTQHNRDSFPDEPYWVNGGRTNRVGQGPSFYASWQS